MKTSSFLVYTFFILCGCVSIKPPASHSEILDEYKQMSIRLDEIIMPLRAASLDLCTQKTYDNGLRVHKLSSYPKHLRPVAKTHWKLGDVKTVMFARAGSVAEKASLKFGDGVPAMGLAKGELVCRSAPHIRIDDEMNAFANGHEIIVTSALVRSLDDLSLSLIGAHELAHNVLGHVKETPSEKLELEADRWAVFVLARAGLDYKKAVSKLAAIQPPRTRLMQFYDIKKARVKNFRKAVSDIQNLKAASKPLVP